MVQFISDKHENHSQDGNTFVSFPENLLLTQQLKVHLVEQIQGENVNFKLLFHVDTDAELTILRLTQKINLVEKYKGKMSI